MKSLRILLAIVALIITSVFPSRPARAANPPLDRVRSGAIAGNSAGAFHYIPEILLAYRLSSTEQPVVP